MRGVAGTVIPSWRKLAPDQEAAVRRLRAQGVRAAVLASAYGVSIRCIYRTLQRTPVKTVRLVVEGYRADFEIGDLGPVQVTRWYAA